MPEMQSLVTPQALARTYKTYTDPWRAVEQYRRVRAFAADNPDLGSGAIASALGLPRGRVRSWLEGARPDALRGIETANERGWLNLDYGARAFRGLNVLVAWVYARGTIWEQTYVPSVALGAPGARDRLDAAFDAIGAEYELMREGDVGGPAMARAATAGSVLGRVLATLDAPVGARAQQRGPPLPAYLDDAPLSIERDFARAYIVTRAGRRFDPTGRVQFREARQDEYVRELARFLERVAGDTVRISETTVTISRGAISGLGERATSGD